MEALLDVRELSVRYRPLAGAEVRALEGASFEVARGEILGVLGESGSGKSTLAASLLALSSANAVFESGAVFLEGQDLLRMRSEEIREVRGRRVSLIFQEPGMALHPTMRVGEQVEEVLRAHGSVNAGERRARARAVFSSVFVEDAERIFRSYPHQLSGGQRQRVAVAQAIACKPALLVADEPTASLDPLTQREILGLFKRLRDELGLAIVFITHYPDLLAGFADRVIVMYAGRIIEEGRAADLLTAPLHPYTRALLACRPRLEEALEARSDLKLTVIAGEPPSLSAPSVGCAFEPRCGDRMDACCEREPSLARVGEAREVSCLKFGE